MATVINNAMLEAILAEIRPLIGRGKVADYIPALASVSGDKLGIAISTVDGQHFAAGDAHERFSIQSISKVLSLVVAMNHYQEEEIWQRVGKDPSGQPFNSLLQLEIEQGKPRNPFINAGALVVCDMLQSRLSAPRQRMLEIVRRLSGVADITYDPVVARSEFEHSARNAAIAWLMKSFGNFHNDVATVLQNYFHYCSVWGGKSGNIVSIRDRRSSIGMPQTLFASGWRPLRRSMMASRRRCAVTRCLSPSTRPLPAVAAAWKNGMPFPTAAR